MQFNTAKLEWAINAEGMEYGQGSVYDRLCKLTDLPRVNGERYELAAVLTMVVPAKLCGEDNLPRIAEWASRKDELLKLLCLNRLSRHHKL